AFAATRARSSGAFGHRATSSHRAADRSLGETSAPKESLPPNTRRAQHESEALPRPNGGVIIDGEHALIGHLGSLPPRLSANRRESRAGANPMGHSNTAAVRLHYRVADRKPHAHAERFGRYERLEGRIQSPCAAFPLALWR